MYVIYLDWCLCNASLYGRHIICFVSHQVETIQPTRTYALVRCTKNTRYLMQKQNEQFSSPPAKPPSEKIQRNSTGTTPTPVSLSPPMMINDHILHWWSRPPVMLFISQLGFRMLKVLPINKSCKYILCFFYFFGISLIICIAVIIRFKESVS